MAARREVGGALWGKIVGAVALLVSAFDGGRGDFLCARGAERRHLAPRAGAGGRAAGTCLRLGNGAFLWGWDRPSRALPVGGGAARRPGSGAGDDHQRLARGGGDAVRAPAPAPRPPRRPAARLRPHPPPPAAAPGRAGAPPPPG